MSTSTPQLDSKPEAIHPLREVWSIAWPTVLTMTSYTVMQFVDSLMVGQKGPLEVAAQGNGGIWAFVPLAIAMGFLTVINTYVSQNLGANQLEKAPQYGWAGLWLSLGIWVFLLLPMAILFPMILPLTHDPESIQEFDRLVKMETGYCQILLVGGIFLLAAKALQHFFFGLHRPKLITVSALVGNFVNAIANYILIFGEAGLPALGLPGIPGTPAMGVYGAALGTVIGTMVEFAIPFAVFIGPKMHREMKTRLAWRPRLKPMRELYDIGWPAALQYGNELICWAIFMTVLVGKFGEHHMTAGWIALRYMHLSFMPAVGFSVAATSLVGKYMGAGQPDKAMARARLTLAMALSYMTVCGVIFFIFRVPLVEVFFLMDDHIDPQVKIEIVTIGAKLMICAALFQSADAIGIVYTGALRGAGDTVWPGLVTMVYSWTFIVGGGWAMVWLFPQLESIGPWLGASAYIILLSLTLGFRFESGFWRSIKLLPGIERDGGEPDPVESASPEPPESPVSNGLSDGLVGENTKESQTSPKGESPST
ncbi:MAG: MATE family efflux transporter [Planctomycetota bacterium]|nr:MATE family efflux transporter [Planctomycetota bacterium]